MKSEADISEKIAAAFVSLGIVLSAVGDWRYIFLSVVLITMFAALYSSTFRKSVSAGYFTSLLVAATVFSGVKAQYQQRGFSIQNGQKTTWLDVQRWAKEKTDYRDVFIVPPTIGGFRVESERTIYGEWKDGTQMFFNPAFGYEWFERMVELGYEKDSPVRGFYGLSVLEGQFKSLNELAFIKMASKIRVDRHKAFLIMFAERDILNFPVVFANKRFRVYEVVSAR